MAETRDFDTAAHEAAHVVVGVAVGLRLRRAVVGTRTLPSLGLVDGYALFTGRARSGANREGFALMYAAGVVWDTSVKAPPFHHAIDAHHCRELCSSRHGYEAILRASAAILGSLKDAHQRVTRALLERDIRGADIAAIARGERIE